MHSWRRGHYRARRQESYFFFSLQWQIKGCFDFCCTNNKLYLETVAAELFTSKILFTFCPNGNTRGKKRKQFWNQHIFYLLAYCPMHLAVGVGLALWTQGMAFGSRISAAFSMGKSVSVPTKPFPLCQGCHLCDTGFFHIRNTLCWTHWYLFFKSPNHRLIWLPAGHKAGLSRCSWLYSCLLLNKPLVTKRVYIFGALLQ